VPPGTCRICQKLLLDKVKRYGFGVSILKPGRSIAANCQVFFYWTQVEFFKIAIRIKISPSLIGAMNVFSSCFVGAWMNIVPAILATRSPEGKRAYDLVGPIW